MSNFVTMNTTVWKTKRANRWEGVGNVRNAFILCTM